MKNTTSFKLAAHHNYQTTRIKAKSFLSLLSILEKKRTFQNKRLDAAPVLNLCPIGSTR